MHPNKRDANQVQVLHGMGASEEYIARHLNISPQDLILYYQKELTLAEEEANIRVAKVFHDLATSGDYPQMTQAWMEMRAGWTKSSSAKAPQTQEDLEEAHEEARIKLLKLLNRGS